MGEVLGTFVAFGVIVAGTIIIRLVYDFFWNRLSEKSKNKSILKSINKAFNGIGIDEEV